MASKSYALVDRALGGRLWSVLSRWQGEGLSYRRMATRLQDEHGIPVSHETVRQWCHSEEVS